MENQMPVYNQPPVQVNAQPAAPVIQLNTNRKLWKYIVFGILTFGIYQLVFWSSLSNNVNFLCSHRDGRRTMHYCLLFFLVGIVTFGIAYIVWYHRVSNRIGRELERRQLPYSFGSGAYWLWNVLGSFIFVGPFIYVHKICKAMNMICADYNAKG